LKQKRKQHWINGFNLKKYHISLQILKNQYQVLRLILKMDEKRLKKIKRDKKERGKRGKMSKIFEILEKDAAGRIGKLKTPHGIVETPTVMPVINPNLRMIEPAEMKNFGAEILITNAYIIYNKPELKEKALADGLHSLLGFNGPIMTDSGSFQLSVYGDVNVENHEIIAFEQAIGTDIGVPLDIPTGPDADYEKARADLDLTKKRLTEARLLVEETRIRAGKNQAGQNQADQNQNSQTGQNQTGQNQADQNQNSQTVPEKKRGDDMLIAAPIQGGAYLDLRAESASFVSDLDFDIYPIGAVVPLMESYRYEDLVNVIAAVKKNLDPTVPVHLFGAGHPMMFALAVALGCDLFDSAAYALYAKGGRYITANGTYQLDRLKYLPCSCPICTAHTAQSIQKAKNKEELLARHNLYVTFEEIRQIKQAINDGKLMELVELRCHSHPQMQSALDALYKHAGWLEECDGAVKSTFLECSAQSARRQEVLRYAKRLDRFELKGNILIRPAKYNKNRLKGKTYDSVLLFKPPFGAYPEELEENYPFNAEVSNIPSRGSLKTAVENTIKLIQLNPKAKFTFLKGRKIRPEDNDLFKELEKRCEIPADKNEAEQKEKGKFKTGNETKDNETKGKETKDKETKKEKKTKGKETKDKETKKEKKTKTGKQIKK
jgi:7-cyano-7-deazaguanine tRNA-ribosyltransferase